MSGYKISDHFAQRLKATVLKVDRIPETSSAGLIATRNDEPLRRGAVVRLGKTSGVWAKNSKASIVLHERGDPPNEQSSTTEEPYSEYLDDCVNKMTTVGGGKWVIVARAGNGHYYLIAAEC